MRRKSGVLKVLVPSLALVIGGAAGAAAHQAQSESRTESTSSTSSTPTQQPTAQEAAGSDKGSAAADPAAKKDTASTASAAWTPGPEEYKVKVERDVKIEMSDGIVIRADIHRPADADGKAAPGRFPVVLTQNPYNKMVSGPLFAAAGDYFVKRGYVFVQTDVRGTGASGGTWDSFGTREQKDGLEIANWITSKDREWSNGTFGMWGASYMGINQFFTAAQKPRGLKAMFPIVPAGDVYRDVVVTGGQIDAGFIPLWLGLVTATGVVPPASTVTEPDATLSTLLQHVGGVAGFQVPHVANSVLGGDAVYDGAFYKERSPLRVVDDVDVPTFLVGGEHDIFQRGTPMLFDALQKNGVDSKLLIGPWTHLEAAVQPDISGSGVGADLNEVALRWFDKHLKGEKDANLDKDIAPVTYHELGSGTWLTLDSWLGEEVSAKSLKVGEDLEAVRGDTVAPLPVKGLCSRSTAQWTAGILKIPGCADINNLDSWLGASYQTKAMAEDLEIAGPINANLSVSTTGTDGLVSVSVEDIAPNGKVTQLTAGWQTLRHRATTPSKAVKLDGKVVQPWHPFTREAELKVKPGEVYRVPVEVFPTGAVIKKGHKLRITVGSYDLPHLLPNLKQLVRGIAGVVTVHHTKTNPSTLILPVRR